jgi:hypothetical protein
MIYQKGDFYKYEGSAQKFKSYAEALKASGITVEQEEPPKVEDDLSPLEQMWKSAEKISSPTE